MNTTSTPPAFWSLALWRSLKLIWRLGGRSLLLIGVPTLISGILPMVSVWALGRFVDATTAAIYTALPIWQPLGWGVVIGLLQVANTAVSQWGYYWGTKVDGELQAALVAELLEGAYNQPLRFFETPQHQDKVQFLAQGLHYRLRTILELCVSMPAGIITVCGLAAYLGRASIWLPWIMIAGALPLLWARTKYFRAYYWHERQQTPTERRAHYLEGLLMDRGAEAELKLYGAGEGIVQDLAHLYDSMLRFQIGWQRRQSRNQIGIGIAQVGVWGYALITLANQYATGNLSTGVFASSIEAMRRFMDSLFDVLMSWTQLEHDLRYYVEAQDYLRPREVGQVSTGEEQLFSNSQLGEDYLIYATDVSFVYPNTKTPALEDVNIAIKRGEHVALVGPNGAGKTTLVKILLGLYTPTSGLILFSDKGLRVISPPSRLPNCAAVFQDFQKYPVSVRENIGFGCLPKMHDESRLQIAAARAGVDEFVKQLPNKYDTILGKEYDEKGYDLSEGQWQRVAIARAMFADAQFIVLDEPTASLDAQSEIAVYENILKEYKGKTLLLVSHRLAMTPLMDKIIVLEAGRVVECGTHEQLIQQNGLYAHMYRLQSSWYKFTPHKEAKAGELHI
ncbi:MAG: ABC transporter ATP-binding protein [Candidatus Hadarchaeum sp.]